MKRLFSMIFVFLVVGIFVVIKVQDSSGPGKYSRDLTREYEKVMDNFSPLERAIDSRSYVSLKMMRKKALVQISHSVDRINQWGDFEGDDRLRISVLNLLDFYERFLQNDLTEALDICNKDRNSRSDYEKSRLESIKDDFLKREDRYLTEVQNAEEQFAHDHNIDDIDKGQNGSTDLK
jgi:hypothetical protein